MTKSSEGKMTAKEKVLKVHPRWCEGSDGAIYKNKNRLAWDKVADSWQNAAESLPAQPEQILDGLGEALQRGEVFAQGIGADVPEHVWDEFELGRVESLPVEAKGKVCPNCNHKAHFALRCGVLIATGSDGEFAEEVRCECLNWAAEPKPTPSTPADPTNTHGLFIKWDDDDRIFVAHIPEMDWITGHGDTREAAISMVEDNYREALNNLIRKPQPDSSSIPEQTPYPLLSNEWLEKFAPGTTMPGRVQSAHMAQELQQWRKWAAAKTIPEQTFEEWYDKARPLPDMSDGEFGQLVWNAAKGLK